MKHLRNYLTLLLVALLGTLTFIACDKDKDDDSDSSSDSIVGTWTGYHPKYRQDIIEFTFNADDTYTDSYTEIAEGKAYTGTTHGTYRIEGDELLLIPTEDSNKYLVHTYKYSIVGNKLTMILTAIEGVSGESLNEQTYVLTRKK